MIPKKPPLLFGERYIALVAFQKAVALIVRVSRLTSRPHLGQAGHPHVCMQHDQCA